MAQNIPWLYILNRLRKKASNEESRQLDKWLIEDEEHQKIASEIFEIYSVTTEIPELFIPDKEKAWSKINRRLTTKPTSFLQLFNRFKYAAAVAAIILVGFISFWLINNAHNNTLLQQQTEIVTSPGQKTMVVLPDSSVVWLNSGSSLKYQGNFNLKERVVTLEGEAYFKVQKDKSKRFRVKTGILDVDVYGTEFDVKNYSDDDIQEITVAEGKVGISYKNKELRQLTGNDQALFNKSTNKIEFTHDNHADVISAWKNDELIFDNTPLEEVVKYLERWYGVHITIEDAMKGKHNYTFKIKTESFREMMEMMKVMTPLEYEINGKDVKIRYAN
jgi:ferric-dicitrate binding protein FerR (iron transport regulator)